jgi:hypothetical protein
MKSPAFFLSLLISAAFLAVYSHERNASLKSFSETTIDGQMMLGYSSSSAFVSAISASLNDAVYDKKMRDEVAAQRRFFQGVNAEVEIMDERSYELRNAYSSKRGKIYFGKNMFYYTIRHFNELAVAGILAHEWGHRVQFTFHWDKQLTGPELELEADALSGYYMALEKSFAWGQIDQYFASTFNTGDYEVASPQHHGTPNQRVAAAYLGVQLAVEAVNSKVPFTYQELHERIISDLHTHVINEDGTSPVTASPISEIANGKLSGKEIVAPVLNAQERKKYYPYSN